MIKQALLALAVSGTMLSAQAGVVLSEGFDDVTALAGWTQVNASSPIADTAFRQGNTAIFTAQTGAENSFISASFVSAAPGGTISDWLITPVFSAVYGATVTFWLRGDILDNYTDTITFGFSDGSTALTSFVLGTAVTATGTWTQITATLAAGSANTYFAINYAGLADSLNYIGLDNLVITANDATGDVPEPASLAILGAGLLGMGAARRRKNRAVAA